MYGTYVGTPQVQQRSLQGTQELKEEKLESPEADRPGMVEADRQHWYILWLKERAGKGCASLGGVACLDVAVSEKPL